MINRRNFMKSMLASSASLALAQSLNLTGCAKPHTVTIPDLGGLTTFALLDDCACLAVQGNLVSPRVANLIHFDYNLAAPANLSRMGFMIKASPMEVLALFNKLKPTLLEASPGKYSKTDKNDSDDKPARILALLSGWLMASGIRTIIQPLYLDAKKSDSSSPPEMSIYHDMFVLKQIAPGENPTAANSTNLASLFNGMVPRMITRTHTLTPDYDDGEGWILRISTWRDKTIELMNRYAEVYLNPDSQKMDKYILKSNFYYPDDPIIQLTRKLQNGFSASSNETEQVIRDPQNKSLYAQALALGCIELYNNTKN
ncbi:hypothetical protein JW964_15805 [candidate division KSB1 bacterium]|nr:hypothetical protein [candidate division KSB1 bacterium]